MNRTLKSLAAGVLLTCLTGTAYASYISQLWSDVYDRAVPEPDTLALVVPESDTLALAVPEPGPLALLALGLIGIGVGLALSRRRRRSSGKTSEPRDSRQQVQR